MGSLPRRAEVTDLGYNESSVFQRAASVVFREAAAVRSEMSQFHQFCAGVPERPTGFAAVFVVPAVQNGSHFAIKNALPRVWQNPPSPQIGRIGDRTSHRRRQRGIFAFDRPLQDFVQFEVVDRVGPQVSKPGSQSPPPRGQGRRRLSGYAIMGRCRNYAAIPGIRVTSFDHVTIICADLEATRRFYVDVLGMTEVSRPAFGFPGLWFQLGNVQIHATQESPEAGQAGWGDRGGKVVSRGHHIAFAVDDVSEALEIVQPMACASPLHCSSAPMVTSSSICTTRMATSSS